jgi:hypothetical protein
MDALYFPITVLMPIFLAENIRHFFSTKVMPPPCATKKVLVFFYAFDVSGPHTYFPLNPINDK